MSQSRIEWLDSAKGIGIILVMLGHSPFLPDGIKQIYSFHMPLFFFLSGYLFSVSKYKSFNNIVKHKFKSLIIPYINLSLINYILWLIFIRKYWTFNAYGSNIYFKDVNLFTPLLGIFVGLRSTQWMLVNDTMWFILCLFCTEILFYIIIIITKNKRFLVFITLVVFSLLGFWYAKTISIKLPWSLDVTLNAVVFFGLGYLVKDNFPHLFTKSRSTSILLLFVSLAINSYFSKMNSAVNMWGNTYGTYFFFYLAAISGLYAIVLLSNLLPRFRFLNFLGRNTLIILSLHIFIFYPIYERILSHSTFFISSLTHHLRTTLAITGPTYIIVTSILIIPIAYIINNFFPFIIGKKIG